MADVFISYKKEDRAWAKQVADALSKHGITAWWDNSLVAGEHWSETIRAELRSSRCVVVLWSKRSWVSRWVQAEANSGFERDVLIAARLDSVALEPPFNLVQTADLRQHTGLQDLCFGVAKRLGLPMSIEPDNLAGSDTIGPSTKLPKQASMSARYDEIAATYAAKRLRPIPDSWGKPGYLRDAMAAGTLGLFLFGIAAAANNGDPRGNFILSPLYFVPVLGLFFLRRRLGWWGVALLGIGVTFAHMVGTIVADEIYVRERASGVGLFCSTQECRQLRAEQAERHELYGRSSALLGGAVGGGLGALLSFLFVGALSSTLRTVRTFGWAVLGIVILSALGFVGFLGALPDDTDKDGMDWVMQLYVPWQFCFTLFLAQILRDHQAARYLRRP